MNGSKLKDNLQVEQENVHLEKQKLESLILSQQSWTGEYR